MSQLTALYSSERIAIAQYDCNHSPSDRVVEEASDADEFVFVLRGVYGKQCSDGNLAIDPTRVAVFRKAQPFSITHPAAGGDRSIILAFDPADLCTAFAAEPDARGTALRGVPATLATTPSLLIDAGRLFRALRAAPIDELQVEELAYRILDSLTVTAARTAPLRTASGPNPSRVLDVAAVLSSRYCERISIDEIARTLGVSPFHLCRSFRVASGTTIHRYLTVLRMTEAVRRLWDYRMNLTDLALDLGYSSHSHFSSTFRGFFGTTPGKLIAAQARR